MSLGVGEVFAGYTVVRMLGSGGQGEVYLVRHPRLPRHDALKVLPTAISHDAEFRSRFEREADLAATLWHPHIVGVHDRGEVDGRLWISMDYVEGSDAAKLVRDHHPDGMPASEVTDIVTAVADALDYAHDQQLLHRDVKPGNILLTDPTRARRRILLADFGIARQSDDVNGLTATNMTVGSVAYTAPEQLLGEPIDGRVDQYSLAATAYHLLTGAPPFSHSNSAVVIGRHLNTPPPQLGDVRPHLTALDPVLAKALAKDPHDRYPTCHDFAAALREHLNPTALDGATTITARPVPRASASRPVDAPTTHLPAPPPDHPTVHQTVPPSTKSTWGTPQPAAPQARAVNTPPPPDAPEHVPAPRRSRNTAVVVGAAAAVVLAIVVAVVVVSISGGGGSSSLNSREQYATEGGDSEASALVPSSTSRPSATSAATTKAASVRPPDLVQTPDAYRELCGNGLGLAGRRGWAAQGGRGSTETSCYFTYSVLKAYWDRYPTPSTERRQVIAEGKVPCNPSTAQCSGSDYVMTCQAVGADPWITCTGGRNARVYIY